ncbi:uncharacterized protein [Panulirus ornatus]|uniref:uncharacterized protein isoform X2 n=1 Tax=Panulirus ornatus TaxID=150431 RepID=UPI003A8C4967
MMSNTFVLLTSDVIYDTDYIWILYTKKVAFLRSKAPIFMLQQYERTTEQEKQEKQRQIPFHQHINLEQYERTTEQEKQEKQRQIPFHQHINLEQYERTTEQEKQEKQRQIPFHQHINLERQYERTTEQEKQEKQRQIPFHQHINLEETIHHSDLPTQILYNRTMVQLELCAFRHGNIKEAHNALLDIQSGGRAKELLAQGLLPQRQYECTTEQEKQEKQRQIPFHQHINLEMLECVYLVSAMLIEIPYMAAHEFDARRRMISKSFHHQLKNSERQSLVGPPESMREHVVAASKAMRNGNWKQCRSWQLMLSSIPCKKRIWPWFCHLSIKPWFCGKDFWGLTHLLEVASVLYVLFFYCSLVKQTLWSFLLSST